MRLKTALTGVFSAGSNPNRKSLHIVIETMHRYLVGVFLCLFHPARVLLSA